LKRATTIEPPMAGQTFPTVSPMPAREIREKFRCSSWTCPEELTASPVVEYSGGVRCEEATSTEGFSRISFSAIVSVMLTAKVAITEMSSRYEDEDDHNLVDAAQRKVGIKEKGTPTRR
jgi:hypothetical protein